MGGGCGGGREIFFFSDLLDKKEMEEHLPLPKHLSHVNLYLLTNVVTKTSLTNASKIIFVD